MVNEDSIYLLKECDAGTKMGVASIDDVLEYTHSQELKELLSKSKAHHTKLGDEIHALLLEYGSDEKEASVMAKGMSWMKTSVKMTMDNSNATVADLITDGCNMGIKSLYRYMNQYPAANEKVKGLCEKLIEIEDELRRDLRAHL